MPSTAQTPRVAFKVPQVLLGRELGGEAAPGPDPRSVAGLEGLNRAVSISQPLGLFPAKLPDREKRIGPSGVLGLIPALRRTKLKPVVPAPIRSAPNSGLPATNCTAGTVGGITSDRTACRQLK
jgi:hypothetical protein